MLSYSHVITFKIGLYEKLFYVILLISYLVTLNGCLFVPYAVEQEAEYSENFDYSVVQVSNSVLDLFKDNKNITLTKSIITNERAVIEGKVNSKNIKVLLVLIFIRSQRMLQN